MTELMDLDPVQEEYSLREKLGLLRRSLFPPCIDRPAKPIIIKEPGNVTLQTLDRAVDAKLGFLGKFDAQSSLAVDKFLVHLSAQDPQEMREILDRTDWTTYRLGLSVFGEASPPEVIARRLQMEGDLDAYDAERRLTLADLSDLTAHTLKRTAIRRGINRLVPVPVLIDRAGFEAFQATYFLNRYPFDINNNPTVDILDLHGNLIGKMDVGPVMGTIRIPSQLFFPLERVTGAQLKFSGPHGEYAEPLPVRSCRRLTNDDPILTNVRHKEQRHGVLNDKPEYSYVPALRAPIPDFFMTSEERGTASVTVISNPPAYPNRPFAGNIHYTPFVDVNYREGNYTIAPASWVNGIAGHLQRAQKREPDKTLVPAVTSLDRLVPGFGES